MKNIRIILLALILFACGKEENPLIPPKEPVTAGNYFPGGVGSSFEYLIESIDSTANVADTSGSSIISFDSTVTYNSINYTVANSSFVMNGAVVPLKFLFRKTTAGIYFTIDTSGFNQLLPDSLLQDITINSDPEANAFSYPLFDNKIWTAYKLNIGIGAFELSLIDVQAYYKGKENIITPATGNAEAEKILYKADIKIPDPNNLVSYSEIKFDIIAWFVKDVGLAKIESNSTAANIITGSNAFSSDSSVTIRQTLKVYDIK